jgi:hypothetical protein
MLSCSCRQHTQVTCYLGVVPPTDVLAEERLVNWHPALEANLHKDVLKSVGCSACGTQSSEAAAGGARVTRAQLLLLRPVTTHASRCRGSLLVSVPSMSNSTPFI